MISEPAVRLTCDGCGYSEEVEFYTESASEGMQLSIRKARIRGWHVGRHPKYQGERMCLCPMCRLEARMPLFMTDPCPRCGSHKVNLGEWTDRLGYTQFLPCCEECGFEADFIALTVKSAEKLWRETCHLYVPDDEED